jgi:chromate reductase
MIAVIAGSNRPGSKTLKVATVVRRHVDELGEDLRFINLADLPPEIFAPTSYASKPTSFGAFQSAVLEADGIITVVPEYNGSFPGVLKYFIDMLEFPASLYQKPAAFIGLSTSGWGSVRAVEQLEMVFQYRQAHLFGRRCFIPDIGEVLDASGHIRDGVLADRLRRTVSEFIRFCRDLRHESE